MRDQYEAAYREWKDLEGQLDALRRLAADRARLEELLRFQVQEIEQAAIVRR